ncbi:MAG: hypothetical protein ACE5LX_06290 [Nitrospinota bacterium]
MFLDLYSKHSIRALYSTPPDTVREYSELVALFRTRRLDFLQDYLDKLQKLARIKGSTPVDIDLELKKEGMAIEKRRKRGERKPVRVDFLSMVGDSFL